MYFYVTEKIKTYRKIGIASNIINRYAQYQTLIPDLEFNIYIKLPNVNFGRIFENSFKINLSSHRLGKTECYNAPLEIIRKHLLFLTIIFDFVLVEYKLRYPSMYDLTNRRGLIIEDYKGPKWSNQGLVFLNELYFGKKVPIFEIDRITKNKLKIKIVKFKNTWKELSKITNRNVESLKKNYFNSNIFYEELKIYNGKIINCNNTPQAIKLFFNNIIKDKLYKIFSKKKIYSRKWEKIIEAQNRFKGFDYNILKQIKGVKIYHTGSVRFVSISSSN